MGAGKYFSYEFHAPTRWKALREQVPSEREVEQFFDINLYSLSSNVKNLRAFVTANCFSFALCAKTSGGKLFTLQSLKIKEKVWSEFVKKIPILAGQKIEGLKLHHYEIFFGL